MRGSETGITGREQEGLAITDEDDFPIVALRILIAGGGALLGAAVFREAAVSGSGFQEVTEIFAGIECGTATISLKGSDDYRGRAGGSFDFEIVVGLAQGPEGWHGNGDISTRNGINPDSRLR